MAEVRKIQCPSCGSNSTYKLFDGSYKCNYCQGSFIVSEGRQQAQRPAPVNRAANQMPSPATKKVVLAVVGAFMVLAMMMAGFLITKSTSYGSTGINTSAEDKQPEIKSTMAFAGEKGNVVWILSAIYVAADSLRYELLAVDPQNNTVRGKQLIGALFQRYNAPDPDRVLGDRFLKFGELAYSLINDTALRAYDIYSGKQVLNTSSLSAQIPGPASAILKIDYAASEKRFNVTTTTGDILSFDPLSRTFMLPDQPQSGKEEPLSTELYLSDGLKHHLYRFTKRGDGFPILSGSFIQEARLPGPGAPKTNNVKDIFGNVHIEKVSEKNYFRAQPLLKDSKGNLLILYKTDLSETSPVILESVSPQGNANWRLQDSSLLTIGKAFASEDLGCEYTFSEAVLIISLYSGEKQYMAIDINTGKVLWKFDPKVYMKMQAS